MTDVAAAANAIATAITTSIGTATAAAQPAPTVQLTPFSGGPTEDFRVFKEQIQSSIALSQVPNAGKVDYLKLHLSGGALSYFLELPAASKADLTTALRSLETRYASQNQLELYKLKFQERKFNSTKETPEDYLTDLMKLANIAFPSTTGAGAVDRSGERTRRIRDAFIAGMPTQIRLKLLLRPDTDTVDNLCSQVSKRLVLKSILPDDEANATAFNAVTQPETSTSLVTAINSVIEAQKDLVKNQKEMGKQMTKLDNNFRNSRGNYSRGYTQYRGNFQNRTPRWTGRLQQNWTPRNQGQSRRGYGYNNNNYNNNIYRGQQGYRSRFNPIICRNCGQPGHIVRDCFYKKPPERGGHLPYDVYTGQSKN